MKVFTWASTDTDLKPGERAIARIKTPMPTGFGKTRAVREDWSPVVIHAATEDEARAKAVAWWEAELARYTSATEGRQKRAQALRKKPDSDDVGIIL